MKIPPERANIPGVQPRHASNVILRTLDPALLDRLDRCFETVTLSTRDVLAEQGETVSHVYFVTAGIISRVGLTRTGRSLELACTGREGAVGILDVLGMQRLPCRLIVQLPGDALRIEVAAIRDFPLQGGPLLQRVAAYSSVVVTQLATSAICARFHSPRQRLARWLITAADRAEVVDVPWSQEWIAEMVGGPRSAVSEAAAALRASGAIESWRGGVRIRDKALLRKQSCECVSVVEDAIRRFVNYCDAPDVLQQG